MITIIDDLANNLRAAATIALSTHGPDCPDFAVHKRAAELLMRVADAEETDARLRARERAAALRTARAYLTTDEREEALA